MYQNLLREQRRRINGEVPWESSYRRTVEMLIEYGLTRKEVTEFCDTLELRIGVEELFGYLRTHEIPTAIITGGVSDFIPERYKKMTTAVYANDFIYNQDRVTDVELNVCNNKDTHLRAFCREIGIPVEKTIAVGDGEGDIAMLRTAGVSVAVKNAASHVIEMADYKMCHDDMRYLIPLINAYMLRWTVQNYRKVT